MITELSTPFKLIKPAIFNGGNSKLQLLLCIAIASFATNAAPIDWNSGLYIHGGGALKDNMGIDQFDQTGSLILAVNLGGGAQTLTQSVDPNIAFAASSGDLTISNIGSTYTGFHSNLAGNNNISKSGRWNNNIGMVTLNNLTIGQEYRIQALVVDGRSGQNGRYVHFDGQNQGVYGYGVNGVTWGDSRLVSGTFTADAATQAFTTQTFNGNGSNAGSQLNAILVHSATAQTLYWDNNGATAGFGTAGGTWGTDSNWSTNAAGSVAPAGLDTSTFDDLNFGTGAAGLASGTVNVSGAAQGFKNLTIGAASGDLAIAGSTKLVLAPQATITTNGGAHAISTPLTGNTSSLTKNGAGTLTLTGTNTYGGTTTVNDGILRIAGGTASLPGSAAINAPGTLRLVGNNLTWNNTITGDGTLNVEFGAGGDNTRLNGVNGLTGTIELTKTGATTGDKWYSNATNAPNADLIINPGTQLFVVNGSTFGNIQVSGTGNTETRGAIRMNNGTLAGDVQLNGDTTIGTSNSTISGNVTSGAAGTQTLTLGAPSQSGGNLNLTGIIGGGTGTIALTKVGGGNTTLSGPGSNTYTGDTKVELGTLTLSKTGGATAIAGNVTFGNGASGQPYIKTTQDNQFGPNTVMDHVNPAGQWTRFDLQGTTQTLAGISSTGAGGVIQNSESGSGGNGVLIVDNATDYAFGGHFRDGSSGTLSLVKEGAGTLTLERQSPGNNRTDHSGTTTVNEGRLVLKNLLSSGYGYRSATTVNSGAVLELAGSINWEGNAAFPVTLNNGTLDKTNTGYNTFNQANVTVSGASTINVTNNGSNNQLFIGGGAGTGLTGTGTLTVNNTGSATTGITLRYGVNPTRFNGDMIVNGGVLNVGSGASLVLDNTDLTLAGAILNLNGAFATTATNASVKSLTGNAASSVALGAQILTIGTNNGTGGNFAGGIGGTGALIKTGTGTQTLSGANTYGGTTTVNDGILRITGGTASLPGSAVINAPGTLRLVENNLTWNNTITGDGTLNVEFGTGGANTRLTGVNGLTGTIELTKTGATTGDKWYSNATNAPNADLIINPGTQLFVVNGSTFDNIQVSGTGNTENRGAIRMNNGTLAGDVQLNGDTTIGTSNSTISGNVSSGAAGTQTLTLGAPSQSGGNLNLTGIIGGGTGAIALTKVGGGNTTLSGPGSNTYTGDTKVELGTLTLSKTGGATAIAGNVTFGNGTSGQPYIKTTQNNQFGPNSVMDFINPWGQWTRFDLQGTTQTLAGVSSTGAGGVIQNREGGGGGNGVLIVDNATDYSFGGHFRNGGSGTLSLVKNGAGSFTLENPTGQSTRTNYTGPTTINNGELVLSNTTSFNSDVTVAAGAELTLSRSVNGFGSRNILAKLISGAGTLNIDNTTPGIAGGWTRFISGRGLSNFTGTVNVKSGVLTMDGINGVWSGNPDLNVTSGGLFAIRAQDVSVDALTGDGDVFNSWNGHGAAGDTLTVGAAGGSGTFSGVIHGSNASGGPDGTIEQGILNLVKTGAGTQTLTGNNTYGGTTTVNGGTLLLNGVHTGTGDFIIAPGATFGGNGKAEGSAVSIGGTLSPGNSPDSMGPFASTTFVSGSNYDWDLFDANQGEGVGWDVYNVTGELRIDNADAFSIDVIGLSSITPDASGFPQGFAPLHKGNVYGPFTIANFGNLNVVAGILDNNDVNAGVLDGLGFFDLIINPTSLQLQFTSTVPEPSTYVAFAVLLISLGVYCRRQRQRG